MSPQNSYTEVLTPNVAVSVTGYLRRKSKMKSLGEPLTQQAWHPLRRQTPGVHTQTRPWRPQGDSVRPHQGETKPADTRCRTYRLQSGDSKCCLSSPGCGSLLGQPSRLVQTPNPSSTHCGLGQSDLTLQDQGCSACSCPSTAAAWLPPGCTTFQRVKALQRHNGGGSPTVTSQAGHPLH